MWINVNFNGPLTLGKLRELVNNGKLAEFTDDIPIYMRIDMCEDNVLNEPGPSSAPVLSVSGDEEEINFYNYI